MSNCLFYECLFFFSPPFFSPSSFPAPGMPSDELCVQGQQLLPATTASSARPVHGRRWLWSHSWMETGNRAALGKRLGRWFHLAAPLISSLELVEVFNVISLSFSTLTPFKMSFFSPKNKDTYFCGFVVSLLGTNKNFSKKKFHFWCSHPLFQRFILALKRRNY